MIHLTKKMVTFVYIFVLPLNFSDNPQPFFINFAVIFYNMMLYCQFYLYLPDLSRRYLLQ